MEPSTIWWVLAGITVAAELLIGSFYLLMLSLGMAAGAIAAQAGSPLTVQLVVAAGVGGAAVLLWRRLKQNPLTTSLKPPEPMETSKVF